MNHYVLIRTVVEEPAVTKTIDGATKQHPRIPDVFEALKWLLARKCDVLPSREISGSHYVYRQAEDSIAATPAIVVVYVYDNNSVNIIGVKID